MTNKFKLNLEVVKISQTNPDYVTNYNFRHVICNQ